jgi:[ribosomal protein S5]-alanine N-acetyltransferase
LVLSRGLGFTTLREHNMKTLPCLDTERLLLRPLSIADAESLHPAMTDPVAMQFWPEPAHESVDATRGMLESKASEAQSNWAIVERGTEKAIGFVGFHSDVPPHGFGYFLDRRYWRRGYASEACRAVLSFGFANLGYRQAEAWIDERNAPSLELARKLGFVKVGQMSQRFDHSKTTRFRYLVYGLWAHHYLKTDSEVPEGLDCEQVEPTFPVLDVQRSILFYTEMLGFTLAFSFGEPPEYAAVKSSPWNAGVRLRLRRLSAEEKLTSVEEVIITLNDDVEAYHRRCSRLPSCSPLESKPWGAREFSVEDPDGHKLRFASW